MRKNRCVKALTGLLALCTVFHLGAVDCQAAQTEQYTYTLTISAGNHGTFAKSNVVEVEDCSGSDITGSVSITGGNSDKITVTNLPYGSRVNIDVAADGIVNLGSQSQKYYVKGAKECGHEGSQNLQSVPVTSDLEYVVSYGIQGDMTSYTVRYQNAAGSTLAASRTYRGNVGDRPVVAYRYIEGYIPQAYNITRALVKNEAENIFTFIYTPVAAGGGGGGGTTEEEGGAAAPAAPAEPAAPEGMPAAPGAPAAPAAGGGAGAGAGAGDGGAADAGAGEAPVEVPDGEVPQAEPEELQNVGDEEVPLAEPGNEMKAWGFRNMMGAAAIAGTGSIALMALIVLLVKRRRMQAAAADRDDEDEK